MFVGVVLNPLARKNRGLGRARAEALAQLLGPHGDVRLTESIAELEDAVRALLPRATHLVADGGDGALHWLLNEVRAQEPNPARWPAFVPTNAGTIDFVARKAGVRGKAPGILAALAGHAAAARPPAEIELDAMEVSGVRTDGAPFLRIGFALAAGGIGRRFFDKYYSDPQPSAGTIVKVIAKAVSSLAIGGGYAREIFRPTEAIVTIDGREVPTRVQGAIHAGAFEVNLGGVLRVFPLARERGVLHFQAGAIQPLEMVRHLPALAMGRPLKSEVLWERAGKEMCVEALGEEKLGIILDGERFDGLERIAVRPGPTVRIAQVRAA